jgi:CelD/BcsL family acetyltransferase involved in cellulose biosynthesis
MRSAQSLPELASPVAITPFDGDLDALAPTWSALEEPGHAGAPFRSWAWASAWWKSFSARGEAEVLVARDSRSGRALGLLPLYRARTALGGARLGLLGEGIVGSDYLGLICRAADEPRLARAFADYCATAPYDELCLDGVDAGDALAAALVNRCGRIAVEPRFHCPHVRIDHPGQGRGFDAYLASLPDGTGAQWRRRRRWLEKRPGFAIEEHRVPAAVARALETLFALHHLRWAAAGGSDAVDGPAVEAFHQRAAAALAARGWARVYLLHADGAARAALYGWRLPARFAFYQAGYDPDWQQRSVGTVLLGEVIARAFADGLDEFDFLRGSEPYKLKWANGARATVRLRLRGDSFRARLHAAGHALYWRLRDAGKRALPPATLEWARRARKKAARS